MLWALAAGAVVASVVGGRAGCATAMYGNTPRSKLESTKSRIFTDQVQLCVFDIQLLDTSDM
jgi:hypothetical protein